MKKYGKKRCMRFNFGLIFDAPPPPNGDRVQYEYCQMFIQAEDVIYGARLHPPAQSSRACIYGINKPASSALFSNDVPADALVLARRSPASMHGAIIPHRWNNFQYFYLLCLITNKRGGGVSDITSYYLLSSGCHEVGVHFH